MSKSDQTPRDTADLLQREYGPEGAEAHLQSMIADFTGETRDRALAVLGELRKMQADSELVEAAVCGKLGCRSGEQLAKIDGRVLCPDCRAGYVLYER